MNNVDNYFNNESSGSSDSDKSNESNESSKLNFNKSDRICDIIRGTPYEYCVGLPKYYDKKTGTLFIPFDFNIPLEKLDNLDPKTKIIIFSEYTSMEWYYSQFNHPINNLPKKLKKIVFGYKFNQLVNNLPKKLKYLTFGYSFDKSVDDLPKKLKYLTFGDGFNQKVNYLPKKLKFLKFGYRFNQSIELLPDSIKFLYLGFSYNSHTKKFPLNLYTYSFWIWSEISTTNIHNSVEILQLHFGKSQELNLNNIPINVKKILIHKDYEKFIRKIPWGCVIEYIKKN
jgi:hypothetical protein